VIVGAFVLGAGRAGRGLTRALRASGVPVLALHGRRAEEEPELVSAGPLPEGLLGADVIFVAVRDIQIDAAMTQIMDARPRSSATVLHLSGSAEPQLEEALRARGIACGTFHPLLPLAQPTRAPVLFRSGWVGIDGDEKARRIAREVTQRLGARSLEIPHGRKAAYHAAAVMASNLTVMLAADAERVMRDAGVDPDSARGAVSTLFAAAAVNVLADGASALTGPLARGELGTIRQHLYALRDEPAALRAYVAVSLAAATPGSEIASLLAETEIPRVGA
jgi:predicted short-subunit dehydrogenase-like oxidoreductase (DUF2520 family)